MKILKFAVLIIVLLLAGGALFMALWPSFGGKVEGARLARAQTSPHFSDGKFANVIPQSSTEPGQAWDYIKRQFGGDEQRHPPSAIPVVPIEPAFFQAGPSDGLRAIWLGHASVYVEIDGYRVLLDPVLSDFASPIQGIGPERFHPSPVDLEALPKIDAVLISHDHYDHMDMTTIRHLAANGAHFYVPLGAGAHLERWDVPADQFTELEWGEAANLGSLQIISTEARHYSGRGILDHKDTFWTSWSLVGPAHRAFYSGDTGFSDHFQKIGTQYGPFDLSLIKIGAYGPGAAWEDIHMSAQDAVRAHVALGAERMLPVHWGTFNLGFHDWDEPIRLTKAAAAEQGVALVTPRVGEVVTSGEVFISTDWWEAVNSAGK